MSMIKVENLTFSYPSSCDNIFENINFQIDTDWKLGFVGRNGRGKTTFLNLLLGKYEYRGKIISSVQFEKDIRDFSDGQKKKVLIAKSLCEQAHLYVWDEPLNFIDIYSRMQIEQLINGFSPTMIFVEHDGVFRDTVSTKTVHL